MSGLGIAGEAARPAGESSISAPGRY